jgi:short-subunit dehydrogenase
MELRGANAIVTGASRGIGVHIARALAAEGVNLALTARSGAELDAVRAEMAGAGVKAAAIVCDIADPAERAELAERAEAEVGPIDIVVNNAGIETASHFHTTAEHDLQQVLDVNLVAPMMLTRAVLPGMLERGRGHVVNIASGAGKVGVPYEASYATSKHGLVGLTRSLRAEYSASPVGFSVVCPAFVSDTGMYDRWVRDGVKAPWYVGWSRPKKVAKVVVSCIRRDRGEVLVNVPPVRPLVTLLTVAPAIEPAVMRILGYTGMFERAAEIEQRRGSDD